MSNVELADRIGLSESSCFRRLRALEDSGCIAGYSAVVDRRKLGLEVTAFVLVAVAVQEEQSLAAFLDAVAVEESIIECHAMSGSHDYLLKAVARNIDHFSDLIMNRILKIPGVKSVESNFSLRAVKEGASVQIS
jgi:Lrp/AsnC family leucine-responsive transcriptional regulator